MRILDFLLQQQWAMEPVVLQQLTDIVLRHDAGDKLERAEIDAIVAANGDDERDDITTHIDGDVAVIPIRGVISKGSKNVQGVSQPRGTATGQIERDIAFALAKPNVKSMVLAIDSPGGTIAGVEQAANFIRKAGKQKPIVAFADDMMASAAYWLGSQTSAIFANATAHVGSIGVYMVLVDSTEMHAAEGVRVELIKSAQFKGIGVRGTGIGETERAELQRGVDAVHGIFVQHVARGRGLPVATVRDFADGRIHIGSAAVKVGLVDRIGSLADAVRHARQLAVGGAPIRGEAVSGEVMGTIAADVDAIKMVSATVSIPAAQMKGQAMDKTNDAVADVNAGDDGAAVLTELKTSEPAIDVGKVTIEAATAAVKAERERVGEVRAMGGELGMSAAWIDQHVTDGTSIADVRAKAIDEMRKTRAAADIVVVEDLNASTIAVAMRDALCLRAGTMGDAKPHERASKFRVLSMSEMAREFLVLHGDSEVSGMSKADVCRRVFRVGGAYMGAGVFSHATGDFPLLLADATNKRLLDAYAEAPSTWDTPGLMRRRTTPDFKTIRALRLGESADLVEVPEGAEYTEATIGETAETYNVVKYGRLFSHTWEMLINDDLDAFSRIPTLHGRAAKRLENVIAWTPITTADKGATMGTDSVVIFHSDHNNLVDSGGTINVASLGVARRTMRKQTGINGAKLNLQARFLIVPTDLETVAQALLGSLVDPAITPPVNNIFQNAYTLVVEALLDDVTGTGSTGWYMFANSGDIDTIEVAFLEGNEQPFLDQEDGFNTDGRTYKVRHVVGSKAIDFRGMFKNDGA